MEKEAGNGPLKNSRIWIGDQLNIGRFVVWPVGLWQVVAAPVELTWLQKCTLFVTVAHLASLC